MENIGALSEQRREQREIIKQLRLIDDTFMSKVFEDKTCAELLLRVILDKDDLTVLKVDSQIELKNLQGRSSRLDIYAVDSQGKQYDIESSVTMTVLCPDVPDTTAALWTQICC